MYLVLSAFTSSPISLVATTKASAFSFTVYLTDFNQTLIFSAVFEKYSNLKFQENMSNGSRIVPCGQTDFDEASSTLSKCYERAVGRDSSVDIATRYGLDGPRTESPWGREIFRTSPDRP